MLIVFLTVPVFPTLPPNLTLVPIVSDRRNLRFINPSVIPTTDCKCLSSVYTSLSPPLEDESRFYLIVQSLNENKDFVGFYVFYSLCNQKICTVKSVTSPYWKVFTLSLLPSGYSRGRIMELSKRSNTVSFPFESIWELKSSVSSFNPLFFRQSQTSYHVTSSLTTCPPIEISRCLPKGVHKSFLDYLWIHSPLTGPDPYLGRLY